MQYSVTQYLHISLIVVQVVVGVTLDTVMTVGLMPTMRPVVLVGRDREQE